MLEQELLPHAPRTATLLSQIEVDPDDPAFQNPTKFIGPVYDTREEPESMGFTVREDGKYFRRVVPSPIPKQIVPNELEALRSLVENDFLVICAGGGGIPVARQPSGAYRGVEAVIDKDRAACMIAKALNADGFVILTDVPGIAVEFGTDKERWIRRVTPEKLRALKFPEGSMGPKVEAALEFVDSGTNKWAAIGSLVQTKDIVAQCAGTRIVAADSTDASTEIDLYPVSE